MKRVGWYIAAGPLTVFYRNDRQPAYLRAYFKWAWFRGWAWFVEPLELPDITDSDREWAAATASEIMEYRPND